LLAEIVAPRKPNTKPIRERMITGAKRRNMMMYSHSPSWTGHRTDCCYIYYTLVGSKETNINL
jgi:hypothetical protein